MNKCLCCGQSYNPQQSDSFFNFKYCSEACEKRVEEQTAPEIYMCISPLCIRIYDGAESKRAEMIEQSTKWQRDDSQSRGLHPIHLVNVSGRANERIGWVEVNEQMLARHFRRI